VINRKFVSLLTDERGTVAFESLFVLSILLGGLFLPITDVCVAAYRVISAYQDMRDLGTYALYNPPSDVTSTSSWQTSLKAKMPGSHIDVVEVGCGDPIQIPCASNTAIPKYFHFRATVSLSPMVLSLPTYQPEYWERFQ